MAQGGATRTLYRQWNVTINLHTPFVLHLHPSTRASVATPLVTFPAAHCRHAWHVTLAVGLLEELSGYFTPLLMPASLIKWGDCKGRYTRRHISHCKPNGNGSNANFEHYLERHQGQRVALSPLQAPSLTHTPFFTQQKSTEVTAQIKSKEKNLMLEIIKLRAWRDFHAYTIVWWLAATWKCKECAITWQDKLDRLPIFSLLMHTLSPFSSRKPTRMTL